jgi:hypothetical protein
VASHVGQFHVESVVEYTDPYQNNDDSIKREVLYKILLEFGIPMKLVGLIKMC